MAQYALASELAFGVIKAAVQYLKEQQAEETQRAYVRAQRDVLVTALHNQRDLPMDYFDKRFAERRSSLEEFYRLLHLAVERRDTEQLQAALGGILGVLRENPLGDLVEFRKNWENPNYSIDL